MLKSIEIIDFESHEHTVIKDLPETLAMIVGVSNSGKSSIVRALKLASFNQFDPASIRIGKNKCTVIVTTERGTVKVTRGPKINTWEITPNGQPTQYLEKVGKAVVPEAAAIIGLNIIKLGDVEIPVNIMNQLESHFMLASMGGQDATGSLRAQVVDEISGLSGIEGVIKDVSLDIHRFGREVKITEDSMETIRARLHDEKELERESEILAKAEAQVAECERISAVLEAANKHIDIWNAVVAEVNESEAELAALPDVDAVLAFWEKAKINLDKYAKADALYEKFTAAKSEVESIEAQLAQMPDAAKAKKLLAVAEEKLAKYRATLYLYEESQKVRAELASLENKLAQLEKIGDPTAFFDKATVALEQYRAAAKLRAESVRVGKDIAATEEAIKKCDADMVKARSRLDERLKKVQVCPLTLGPVSQECLEKAKTA
jgi:hypothetical protein